MIGPFGLKPKGTMAVRALPLAKALTRRGHQVSLVLPPWSYPPDSGKVWLEEGVRIDNTTISPRAFIPFRLLAHIRTFQPDVIHVFKPKAYAGLAQWLLWQLKSVGISQARLVLDEDDWEGAGGWNDMAPQDGSKPYSPIFKRFFAWQEQWGLRHADAVTSASRALESIVWSLGIPPAKVLYLPNGVNALPPSSATGGSIRQELHLGDAPVLLLYTRFFEYDLARLVRILSQVFSRMPGAKLVIVGKGMFGEENRFLEMANTSGWRDAVIDAGWVDPTKLRGYFAASDAAIFPFDDTLLNRCKCSVKLIDLLANGVPVVADAVGQNKEYIRHNESGVLVAPGNVDAFTASVLDLLGDQEKRARLGACASATMMREFSWELLAEGVERVYSHS